MAEVPELSNQIMIVHLPFQKQNVVEIKTSFVAHRPVKEAAERHGNSQLRTPNLIILGEVPKLFRFHDV